VLQDSRTSSNKAAVQCEHDDTGKQPQNIQPVYC
jgi:hypothetical protein